MTTILYRVTNHGEVSRLMDASELDAYLYNYFQAGGNLLEVGIHAVAQLGVLGRSIARQG